MDATKKSNFNGATNATKLSSSGGRPKPPTNQPLYMLLHVFFGNIIKCHQEGDQHPLPPNLHIHVITCFFGTHQEGDQNPLHQKPASTCYYMPIWRYKKFIRRVTKTEPIVLIFFMPNNSKQIWTLLLM